MSYKNAMAGLPLGGGKSVIRRPHGRFDRDALFRSFARVLNSLGGDYLAAEDVGTTPHDMESRAVCFTACSRSAFERFDGRR